MENSQFLSELEAHKLDLVEQDICISSEFLLSKGYEIQGYLGVDSFGAMILARNIKSSKLVAIKIIHTRVEAENIVKSSLLMQQIRSKNILSLEQIYIEQLEQLMFLILQYCPNGNLQTLLNNNKNNDKKLTDLEIVKIFIGICKGLISLRSVRIIHSDLKPENIFLSENNTPLLANFEISKQLIGNQLNTLNQGGSPLYMAFEQAQGQLVIQTDYFSAGMVLLNLCGYGNIGEMFAMKYGQFPDITGREREYLLKIAFSMMEFNPEDRTTPDEVVKQLNKIIYPYPKHIQTNESKDNGTYKGELEEGILNGQGKFIYKNGDIYEGAFRDDLKCGKGQYFFSNGDMYVGEFSDGEARIGQYFYQNEQRYEGMWKDGQRHGQGKQYYENGDILEGEWQGNNQCQGKFCFVDGDIYEGRWKDGLMQGIGKYSYKNGDVYEGNFLDGEQNGQGTLFTEISEYQEEDWQELLNFRRIKYEGDFENGQFNGNGKMCYGNGNRYEGEFRQGRIEGQGKLFQESKAIYYEGQWKDNKQHGEGKMIDQLGVIKQQGIWKKGFMIMEKSQD